MSQDAKTRYGIIILLTVSFIALVSIIFWGHDNFIEEACEDVVHVITDQDIDFSPGSQEQPVGFRLD